MTLSRKIPPSPSRTIFCVACQGITSKTSLTWFRNLNVFQGDYAHYPCIPEASKQSIAALFNFYQNLFAASVDQQLLSLTQFLLRTPYLCEEAFSQVKIKSR